jgi:hypothetical protein
MNLAATVELSFGGVGSGCRGPSCGRKPTFNGLTKEQQDAIKKVPEAHLRGLTSIGTKGFNQKEKNIARAYYWPSKRPFIKLGRDTGAFDLLHEIGHHVHDTVLTPQERKVWKKSPSEIPVGGHLHEDPDREEQFAEAYAHLMSGNKRSQATISNDPERTGKNAIELVKNLLKGKE